MKPTIPARPPHRRHFLDRIDGRSRTKATNTIVLPGIDVDGDVSAINDGKAIRSGDHWVVNGRTYLQEEPGRIVPVNGDGFIQVDRGTYKALTIYSKYDGPNPESDHEISLNPSIALQQRDLALEIWKKRST